MSARMSSRVRLRLAESREKKPLRIVKKVAVIPATKSRMAVPAPRPSRQDSKGNRKIDLMEAARAFGWRGKSYRKAKQFARRLDRERALGGAA